MILMRSHQPDDQQQQAPKDEKHARRRKQLVGDKQKTTRRGFFCFPYGQGKKTVGAVNFQRNAKLILLCPSGKQKLFTGLVLQQQPSRGDLTYGPDHLIRIANEHKCFVIARQERHLTAMQDTSTWTSLGSRLTSTVSRAGG